MTLELIQSINELSSLESEWNPLLSHSANHLPSLRYEYLSSWWDSGGGGEWSDGSLAVITWRGSDNALQGIAPLFQVNNRLLFLGSFEISDYLDLNILLNFQLVLKRLLAKKNVGSRLQVLLKKLCRPNLFLTK